jgi:hypothetical protein
MLQRLQPLTASANQEATIIAIEIDASGFGRLFETRLQ